MGGSNGPGRANRLGILALAPMSARDFYSQFINAGDLVFDIGANVGDRTAVFLELGAEVIAVEPQTECARQIAARFPHVHVVSIAVGDKYAQATMLICPENSGMSSISYRWMELAARDAVFGSKKWTDYQFTWTTTLDNLIANYGTPAFIKIDAEGSELEIIRGLSQPIKALSFEFHPQMLDDVREILCFDYHHPHLDRRATYSLAETMEFSMPWSAPAEVVASLRQYEGQPMIYGDVYVRTK